MAKFPETDNFRVKELSSQLKLSTSYLAKILQKLTRHGFLNSVTGPRGGFGLNGDPKKINILEVIRTMDDARALDNCLLGWAECGDNNPCPFHKRWKVFKNDLQDHMTATTIQDMADGFWPNFKQ